MTDPADQIAAALSRLRGSRPRPPWAGGEHPHAHGAPHGRGGPHGGPPWMAGRLGGPARMRLLEALAAADVPLSISDVAVGVGVDQPRASRLVQQSVELGQVVRTPDPDDARRTRLGLTDAGAALVREFQGGRRDAVGTALGGFTDAEKADLARLLTRLAEAWPRP